MRGWIALKLAWRLTNDALVGSYQRLAASIALTILGSLSSFLIAHTLGRDWPGDELIPLFVGPVAFCSVFLILLFFNWTFRTPYHEWARLEAEVGEMRCRLSPRFSVVPAREALPVYPPPQQVSVTHGGRIQSNRSLSEKFLVISVRNETNVALRGCEAYLTRFQRIGAEDAGWPSLRLAWMETGDGGTSIDIPPLGERALKVFRVLGNRALFLTSALPGELVHSLADKAEFEGVLTLTSSEGASTFIPFELSCDALEREPTISVSRKTYGESEDGEPWAREIPIF